MNVASFYNNYVPLLIENTPSNSSSKAAIILSVAFVALFIFINLLVLAIGTEEFYPKHKIADSPQQPKNTHEFIDLWKKDIFDSYWKARNQ